MNVSWSSGIKLGLIHVCFVWVIQDVCLYVLDERVGLE